MTTSGKREREVELAASRHYYVVADSSELTLPQIRELIEQGKEVRVVDAESGEDVTARVLARIILAYESSLPSRRPLPSLEQSLRLQGLLLRDCWQALLQPLLEYSLRFWLESQRLLLAESQQRVAIYLGVTEGTRGVPPASALVTATQAFPRTRP